MKNKRAKKKKGITCKYSAKKSYDNPDIRQSK